MSMTKSSVNTHVFYVSGCDQCTEPDCVPYKTLCCVVELTYCSFFHQFGVSFLDSCFLDRKTRALFSLRLHSSHVLRQFFGTRTKPAPRTPPKPAIESFIVTSTTHHPRVLLITRTKPATPNTLPPPNLFCRHINDSSPSCSTDHTNENDPA